MGVGDSDHADLWPEWPTALDLELWEGAGPPPCVVDAVARGDTFVAHNAEHFDAAAWARFVPAPHPAWFDTMHACRYLSLPGSLDRLGEFLGCGGKDQEGVASLRLLYRCRGGIYPLGTVPLWQRMLRYNVRDVLILGEVYRTVSDHNLEVGVLNAHCAVNGRGIPVDLDFAWALRDMWTKHKEDACAEVLDFAGIVATPTKVKTWLTSQGFHVDSLERKQIEALIHDPDSVFGDTDDPRVATAVAVIRGYQSAARATAGKVQRIFSVVDEDHRVRGWANYHGAHTGRFSGRDLQPHNMARGQILDADKRVVKFDVGAVLARGRAATLTDVRAAIRHDAPDNRMVGDALAALMRSVIRGDLRVYDYSSVEARGVAWLAACEPLMRCFRDPSLDVYCDMASRLFGRRVVKADTDLRFVGKTVILGCGYGMGEVKFDATCRFSSPPVDLAATGLTAGQCVTTYRAAYPEIPRLWRRLQSAAFRAVSSREPYRESRCWFAIERQFGCDWLCIELPSRRTLRYRNPRIKKMWPRWQGAKEMVDTLLHDGRFEDQILYGGLLLENIVQGFCRDFLVDAMCRLEAAGHPVVLHVHDELVTEGSDLEEGAVIVSTPPAWAADFPLRVEGFSTEHYVKAPPPGSRQVDAMCGRLL